jgi:hypothetical protein
VIGGENDEGGGGGDDDDDDDDDEDDGDDAALMFTFLRVFCAARDNPSPDEMRRCCFFLLKIKQNAER